MNKEKQGDQLDQKTRWSFRLYNGQKNYRRRKVSNKKKDLGKGERQIQRNLVRGKPLPVLREVSQE